MIFVGLDDRENCSEKCFGENTQLFLKRKKKKKKILFPKSRSVEAATGEWMNSFIRRPSRQRFSKDGVDAGDIVARGIRRSWTISSK
jgi:hypothetical protein